MSGVPTFTDGLMIEGEAVGRAAQVHEGVWILATLHRGGGFSRFPQANNRAVILRLRSAETGRVGLVVLNATDPAQSFEAVRELSQGEGVPVTHVVSPGGAHHAYLPAWHDGFDEARILIGDRVPHTRTGAALRGSPRVVSMDSRDPLPEFADELQAVVFTGLLGPKEFVSPSEGAPDSAWATMKAVLRLVRHNEPYDELWVHHRASQTVIGAENLGPRFTAAAHAELPALVRRAIKPDEVLISSQARKVGDRAAVQAAWERVTQWPARHLLGYHDSMGGMFVGDVGEELRRAASAAGQLPQAGP